MTANNCVFHITNKNNKFYFTRSFNDDRYSQISIGPGAYERESLNNEIKRAIIEEGQFAEANYPLAIKLNFSTLDSFKEIASNITGSQFFFTRNDGIRDLLGFKPVIIYEKYNLSEFPVDNLSFHNIFLENDFAHGLIFKSKRTGTVHIFTMDVNPGYNTLKNSMVK